MDSAGKSSTVIDSHCPVIVAVSEITHSFVKRAKAVAETTSESHGFILLMYNKNNSQISCNYIQTSMPDFLVSSVLNNLVCSLICVHNHKKMAKE